MVRNGIFWTIGEQLYIIDYPIVYYQKIKVYIGLKQWIWEYPNGTKVSLGRFSYPLVRQYLLYEIRYLGRINTIIYVRTWNHMLNNVQFLVCDMSKEHGRLIT